MSPAERLLPAVCSLLGLAGCSLFAAGDPPPPVTEPVPAAESKRSDVLPLAGDCGGRLTSEQRMYLELVHKMVEEGQNYAAIAHLDELERTASRTPQTDYLRAEALRGTREHRAEAARIYQALLGGCMAGHGLHGLGLLAAEGGQMAAAEAYLRRAVRERPVSAKAHNDLGMVYLLRGRRSLAREEFLTAAQLDRGNRLPIENLIVLTLLQPDRAAAQRLATRAGLSPEDMQRLEQRAEHLRGPAPRLHSAPSDG